jgi:hypothetical protein
VQAALEKLVLLKEAVPIAKESLSKEREAVAARGGIVAKTAAKVTTDEHTWDDFVEEQGFEVGAYPSEEQVVEFAVWLSMRRERACLAQRAEAGARLTGLVQYRQTDRTHEEVETGHMWPVE